MVNVFRQVVRPRSRVVIQARTTSSRLPAKALLPLGGIPMAVLVAQRVARSGAFDVVVATSIEPEDDLLASIISKAGFDVVRGPLNNVLSRFLMATADMADEDICVRLTADNPGPDCDLVAEYIDLLVSSKVRYLAYGNDGLWLPYGMSAEVFYVGDLRLSGRGSEDPYVQEHVTPLIKQRYAQLYSPVLSGWTEDLGHLRTTVDTLADYLTMAKLFEEVVDPVAVPWRDVVTRRAALALAKRPAGLVLGTVQLGQPYGITRDAGLMPTETTETILRSATDLGVLALDTARAYGESEVRIGAFAARNTDLPKIITKLAPFDTDEGDPKRLQYKTVASVDESCAALGLESLDCLLLHKAQHLDIADGVIWDTLLALQTEGRVKTLGVSVQSPQELIKVLELKQVKHVQLPFNLLDWRWDAVVAELRARPDVTIHVRSVFLQGLLVQKDSRRWPQIAGLNSEATLDAAKSLVADLGRANLQDLAIAYVRAFSWVDGLVLGVDTSNQLKELSALFVRPPLTMPEVFLVRQRLPRAPVELLNPALWP